MQLNRHTYPKRKTVLANTNQKQHCSGTDSCAMRESNADTIRLIIEYSNKEKCEQFMLLTFSLYFNIFTADASLCPVLISSQS